MPVLSIYANIVAETISTIELQKARIGYQKTGTEKTIDTIKSMFGIKSEKDIDEILKDIKELNENLLEKLTYNQEKVLKRVRSEQQESAAVKASSSIQITWEVLDKYLKEKEMQFVGKTLSYDNAAGFIVEFFKQLNHLLDCQSFVIG